MEEGVEPDKGKKQSLRISTTCLRPTFGIEKDNIRIALRAVVLHAGRGHGFFRRFPSGESTAPAFTVLELTPGVQRLRRRRRVGSAEVDVLRGGAQSSLL